MHSDKKYYHSLCKSHKLEKLQLVSEALETASHSSTLDLSEKNLPVAQYEVLGKVIASSCSVQKLNLNNCLVQPSGMQDILDGLCENSSIQDVNLKGNNIQGTTVSKIAKFLRHNGLVKRLDLEWNNLGLSPDAFTLLCDTLAANSSLEVLDLRNNQLTAQSAQDLANAISRNKTLKSLDLQWNSIGSTGAKFLYEAMLNNTTLTSIKLRGNNIPFELVAAIELCGKHTESREQVTQQCKMQTDAMSQQLKSVSFEKSKQLHEMLQRIVENEGHISDLERSSENYLHQLENILKERGSKIASLTHRIEKLESTLRISEQKSETLEQLVVEKDQQLENLTVQMQKSIQDVREKILGKEEEFSALMTAEKSKLLTLDQQAKELDKKNQLKEKQIRQLAGEVSELQKKLMEAQAEQRARVSAEQDRYKHLLEEADLQFEQQLGRSQEEAGKIHESLRSKISSLERAILELEKERSELKAQILQERSRADDEIGAVFQKFRTKELEQMQQLEDRTRALQAEKSTFEQQLNTQHSLVTELQKQNSMVMSEMGELQRKLSHLHESLANEKMDSQKSRQLASEESSRLAEKQDENRRLHMQMEQLQAKVTELHIQQTEVLRAKDRELEKLRASLEQKDRDIQNIRADEAERVGFLYSAFNKYLGSVVPVPVISRSMPSGH